MSRRPGFYILFALVFASLMIAGASIGVIAEQHRIGWLDQTMVYVVSVSLILCIRMLVLAKRARSRGRLPVDLVTVQPDKPKRS
jgi:cytochrome c biogenesis protein CcdA